MSARASWITAQQRPHQARAPSRSCRSIGTPRSTLVSRELTRVKSGFGNRAIFAGSYGWSSAGRLHHAKSLLHRFMNALRRRDRAGRHLFQRGRLGHHAACARRHDRDRRPGTTFDTIAENTQARRVVRRHAAEEFADRLRRHRRAFVADVDRCARRSRHRIRQYQSVAHRPGRRAQGRMAAGDSRHRHRDHDGAGAHAGRRRAARRSVPRALHRRLREIPPLPHGRGRRPAEGCGLGRAHLRASTPRPSASSRAGWRRRAPSSPPPGRCSAPTTASSRSG